MKLIKNLDKQLLPKKSEISAAGSPQNLEPKRSKNKSLLVYLWSYVSSSKIGSPLRKNREKVKQRTSLLFSTLVDDTAMEKGFSESFVDK